MKKKITIGMVVVILLVTTTTVIYAQYLSEQKAVEQNLKQLEISSQNIEDNFYSDPMFEWLYSQYNEQEKREYLIEEYAYTKFFHHMTDVESAYLYQLAQEGKDFYELLRVYEFWKSTIEPIEMIDMIYKNCPEEPYSGWAYKEYMKILGREDEILTNDEIDSYLESGLTEYDIIYARQLSHNNTHSVRDLLNQRKSNENWIDVSDEVYSKLEAKHSKKVKKGLFQNKNVSGKQMYLADNMSDKIGADVCDYLSQEDLEQKKEKYENTVMAKIRKKLVSAGYLEKQKSDTEEYQQDYIGKLTAMGLSTEEIESYQVSGWDYTAIYNAKLISTRRNISMEAVFSQIEEGIPFEEIQ